MKGLEDFHRLSDGATARKRSWIAIGISVVALLVSATDLYLGHGRNSEDEREAAKLDSTQLVDTVDTVDTVAGVSE